MATNREHALSVIRQQLADIGGIVQKLDSHKTEDALYRITHLKAELEALIPPLNARLTKQINAVRQVLAAMTPQRPFIVGRISTGAADVLALLDGEPDLPHLRKAFKYMVHVSGVNAEVAFGIVRRGSHWFSSVGSSAPSISAAAAMVEELDRAAASLQAAISLLETEAPAAQQSTNS
jgi:hypothetical protein